MVSVASLKPIHAGTGVINAGVGSAIFELNGTRVMCAIYGPQVDARQEFSEQGRLTCEVKIAAFARPGRAATATAAADELALAEELHTALSPSVRLQAYPKCSWQLCAFVIEDDGSALAALINCGSLALADASVQMFDTVAACSVVRRMLIASRSPSFFNPRRAAPDARSRSHSHPSTEHPIGAPFAGMHGRRGLRDAFLCGRGVRLGAAARGQDGAFGQGHLAAV
jgi:hypothetical protein